MNVFRHGRRFGGISTWITRILVLAFALRAIVPAGYMPDFAALSKGQLKVAICSPTGTKVVIFDASGKPNSSHPLPHSGQPCAFSGLAAIDLPLLQLAGVLLPPVEASYRIAHLAVSLPPSRAGPPLGSRAPPLTSRTV